jgi:2-polyprenyl-3-methyl-5-hydroxy-6-metoxy-1,4-benzoquinol methylase
MNSDYWNNIYNNKGETEVSWYQPIPYTSLKLLDHFNLHPECTIIDIGGGESRLVDHLLLKFQNITVLDISDISLEKLKLRLKEKSANIKFIASDIKDFTPDKKYDLWHDRAAFHFLTNVSDIQKYVDLVSNSIEIGGYLIISTFSKDGPDKCSGLPITKYSHGELIELFSKHFKNLNYHYEDHETPWSSKQNFVYCVFEKS